VSDAIYSLLKSHTKSDDIVYDLIHHCYTAVGKHVNDATKFDRYVRQKLPHRDPVDFRLFDKRFVNYLTDDQKAIYQAKVDRVPPRHMGLNKTRNCINVHGFLLLKKYKLWVDRMSDIDIKYQELDILKDDKRQIMEYYLEGYSPINIAKELRMSNLRVSVVIYNAIKRIKYHRTCK
jgi:hypothetical protein